MNDVINLHRLHAKKSCMSCGSYRCTADPIRLNRGFIELIVTFLSTFALISFCKSPVRLGDTLWYDLRLSFPLPRRNASKLLTVWYPQYNFSGPVFR